MPAMGLILRGRGCGASIPEALKQRGFGVNDTLVVCGTLASWILTGCTWSLSALCIRVHATHLWWRAPLVVRDHGALP